MKRSQRKLKKELNISYAIRSFVGYLEGTEKALHTVKNYRSDLATFEEFLSGGLGSRPVPLSKVNRNDVEKYADYLRTKGFKTNTRRRKLLTLRRLLRYLAGRNKLPGTIAAELPAPQKIERVPATVSARDLVAAIRALPADSPIQARNRALLWTLAETGCQVSEITRMRFEDWALADGASSPRLGFGGKAPRDIPVSLDLYEEIRKLRAAAGDRAWPFLGFNKYGTLGSPISSRGVELLVKAYAGRLGLGPLTPRTFRHSAVVRWHAEGIPRDEIQKRLGLKTPYAFRIYEPLFKSSSKATSSAGMYPSES